MESSGAMDLVCDNLDVITLTCPESQDPIFHDSPMHVEDDERDELLGLGSPAPSVRRTFASAHALSTAVQEPLSPARHWSTSPRIHQGQSPGKDVHCTSSTGQIQHLCLHPGLNAQQLPSTAPDTSHSHHPHRFPLVDYDPG